VGSSPVAPVIRYALQTGLRCCLFCSLKSSFGQQRGSNLPQSTPIEFMHLARDPILSSFLATQIQVTTVALVAALASAGERVCDYLDAEALALVAVEDFGDGVGSVGMRCPLHALPSGWEEAHDRLQSIAKPLRHALANRPLQDDEV
jgi:hypothetical protein